MKTWPCHSSSQINNMVESFTESSLHYIILDGENWQKIRIRQKLQLGRATLSQSTSAGAVYCTNPKVNQ